MDNPILPYHKNLTLRRLEICEGPTISKKVFRNNKQIYISKGYATKIKAPKTHNNVIILLPITYLKTESLTDVNQIN